MPNSGDGQPTAKARSRGSVLPALPELWFSSSSWRSGLLLPSDGSDPTIGHRREARCPHGTTGTAVSERRCPEQTSNGDTSSIWPWRLWLVLPLVFAAGVGVLLWHRGPSTDPGFVEYRMPVKTDIPTAVAIEPNGAVWFTIEFSDAIAVFRDGKIDRFSKGAQNLEPLGLAVDADGGAWYTDTPMRAISRISPDGSIRSFPLSTPIVQLGRLAVAPDGAVWFADITTASVTRLQDGVFIRHEVGSLGATPYGIAIDSDGTVWATVQGADKLGRISTDGQVTALDVPTRSSGLGDIAVDQRGAVWFLSCGRTRSDASPRVASPNSRFPRRRPDPPRRCCARWRGVVHRA